MVRTFLKVYLELGSYFLFLQEQIKDIIIIEEALEMHTKSLDIKTRILDGDSHLDVDTSYHSVATIYQEQGRYEEELEMHTGSLDIMTRILGGDSHSAPARSRLKEQYR